MKKLVFGVVISALAILSSCNEKEAVEPIKELGSVDLSVEVESVATTEASIDDAIEATDFEIDLYSGSESSLNSFASASTDLKSGNGFIFKNRYRLNHCPLVTIESEEGGYPKTITLNYGDGTELANGRIISGIVEISISARPGTDGATRIAEFQGFKVDSIGMAGTCVRVFSGDNVNQRVVTITRSMVYTLPDATTITRGSERIKTWVAGLDTPFDHSDDEIEITGKGSSEDSDGNNYSKEVTTTLIKSGGCRFIVSGEVTLSKNGVEFATINYGNGECDNIAILKTESEEKEITIGRVFRKRKARK